MRLSELKEALRGVRLSVLCTRGKGADGRWVTVGPPYDWEITNVARGYVTMAPITIHGEPNLERKVSFALPSGMRETPVGSTYIIHPEQTAKLVGLLARLQR